MKEVCQDGSQVQPMEEGSRQDEVEVEEEAPEKTSEEKKKDETEKQVNVSMAFSLICAQERVLC